MSSRARGRGFAIAVLALCVVASGCGLKKTSSDKLTQLAQGQGAVGGDTTGIDSGTGTGTTGTGTTGTGTTGTGTTGTGTTGTGTTGTGTTGTGTTGTATTPGSGTAPTVTGLTGANKTGLTATVLKIGIHAPLTGASPLPQASFESGAKLYWKAHKVFGRTVEAEVTDDTYKPSGAIKVCQEMARRDFIVVGGAGSDQIQACGRDRTLINAHTPYLSAGVTENQLGTVPSYFAISLTYKEQGPLVVKNLKNQGVAMPKVAVAISDTPNFTDAQNSITAALKANGSEFQVFKMSKAPSDSEAASMANSLRTYAAPVVYFLGQPTFFIKVVAQTHTQLYHPIWTGVGISMGVGTVVEVNCSGTSNNYDGRFLSPFPGLDRAPKEFFDSGGKDDIELTLYGLSEMLYKALLNTKGELTRENFINSLANNTKLTGGVYPSVAFAPNDHFGGSAAWSLKSNCQKNGPAGRPGVYDTVGSAPITP